MALRGNQRHIDGADISAYVDEELSSREVARVDAHLQSCDQCRALADDFRATKAMVRQLPLAQAPRAFTLGPEFEVASARAAATPSYAPPRRGFFNFMPAIAMSAAVLLLLVFADMSSLGRSSSEGISAGARQIQDAAKGGASEAQPSQPAAAPPAPQGVIPLQTGPGSGPGGTPQAQLQGDTRSPTPEEVQRSGSGNTPTPIRPLTPGPVTALGQPPPVPTPGQPGSQPTPPIHAVTLDEQAREDGDGGIDLLRALEILATIALVGSLGGLWWQKRRS